MRTKHISRFVKYAVFAAAASLSLALPAAYAETFGGKVEDAIKDLFETSKNEIPYCTDRQDCSLQNGANIVANDVSDLVKTETATQYAQRVAKNILGVLGIVGVLFVIWAGFQILTAGGDDDKVKAGKTIITNVAIGFVVIFLAWSVVSFVINKILTPKGEISGSGATSSVLEFLIPKAAAAEVPSQVTYATYRDQILALVPKMKAEADGSGISRETLAKLRSLVEKSALTLPDTGVNLANNALVTDALAKVDQLLKSPGFESLESQLFKSLEAYLLGAKTYQVSATVDATPNSGNAPLVSTLSVRNISDPSGTPVRNENIIWAVKGPSGALTVIGRGPSVSRRFSDQGKNSVFVAVLSSSKNKAGYTDVIPFSTRVDVDVKERLASIFAYVNGIAADENDEVKVNPDDAKRGLIIDATATSVPAGVTIQRTAWDFGNGNRKAYDGSPKIERQAFGANASYSVWLRVTTNRGENVDRKFKISVHDPIASIEVDKLTGFVGQDFKFKTRSSYANPGLTYVWEVRDPDTGKVLQTAQGGLSFNYTFKKSGTYSVRLRTLAPNGQEDADTRVVTVESREPIARLSIRQSSPETPESYVFDASSSYDPDTAGGRLTYEWTVDGEPARVANPQREGAIGTYAFDAVGEHRVGLVVTNKDGKSASLERAVTVNSLLSVRLEVSPKVVRRGGTVSVSAESRAAQSYEWDFGDGTPRQVTTAGSASHAYQKSGGYSVSLTVRTDVPKPTTNVIRRRVDVVDSESPFAAIRVFRGSEPVLESDSELCSGEPAFPVGRVSATRFSASESINADGTPNGLTYFWRVGTEKNFAQRDASYKFDEVGCQPVTLTVTSSATGRSSVSRAWAKVKNSLPDLSSIDVQIVDLSADPVVVKLTAVNAKDPDGAIASYTWYYFTENDSEPQGFRVTNKPSVAYVLPRISGKYSFAVAMEDTDGEHYDTNDGSSEYSTPTLSADSSMMTPVVKLKASSENALVGDDVLLAATVRNALGDDLSGRDDLELKWDFDGDGFYDRQTKETSAKYSYGLPGQFAPKVKVTYRGVSTTQSTRLTVANQLRPKFAAIPLGDQLLLLNGTSGFYKTSKWSVDGREVSGAAGWALATLSGSASKVSLSVSDGTQEKSADLAFPTSGRRNKLLVRASEGPLVVVSDRLADAAGNLDLSSTGIVVADPSDKVWIWPGASKAQADRYVIDADTSVDSNLNGDPADDADNAGSDSYASGNPFQVSLSQYRSRNNGIRVALVAADGSKIASRDYSLTLAYLQDAAPAEVSFEGVSDAEKAKLEKVKSIVQQAPEKDRLYLMKSLSQLKEMWGDKVGKTETIIAMQGYVDSSAMAPAAKQELYSLLDSLIVSDEMAADEVTLAAGVVKNLIPSDDAHYAEIVKGIVTASGSEAGILDQILSHPNDLERNKELGMRILALIKDDEAISVENKFIIKEQLKVIVYGGAAQVPAAEQEAASSEAVQQGGGFLRGAATAGKWLAGIIAGVLALVMVATLVMKATNKSANTGLADGLIDLFGKGGNGPKAPAPAAPKATPVAAAPMQVPAPKAPAPAVSAAPSPAPKKEEIPDWLKAATGAPAAAPKAPEAPKPPKPAAAPSEAPKANDVPDWLKPVAAAPVAEAKPAPVPAPKPVDVPKPAAPKADDLPDWLKAAAPAPKAPETPKPAVAEAPKAAQKVDDLPDWLKAASEAPAAPAEPAVTVAYERDEDGKIIKKPVAKKKTSAKTDAGSEADSKAKKPSAKKAA